MATIRQRGQGYQIIVYLGRDANGKKKTTSTTWKPPLDLPKRKIKSTLMEYALDYEKKVKSYLLSSKSAYATFNDFAHKYFQDMQDFALLSPTTYVCYKDIFDRRISEAFKNLRLQDITGHTIRNYERLIRNEYIRADKRSAPLSDATIQKDKAVISSILSYAVEEGLLQVNPLLYSGRYKKTRNNPGYKVKALTVEQISHFLVFLNQETPLTYHQKNRASYTLLWKPALKWRLYFLIAICTGARRGEMISLLWSDFDFDKCEIRIDKSTVRVSGRTIHKATKAGRSRLVAVPKSVMGVAKKLQSAQVHSRQSDFVFQRDDGTQMDIYSPRTEFKRLMRIYNQTLPVDDILRLPTCITLHDLRHTTASILIHNRLDPKTVATLLGHSRVSTTLNIYTYYFQSSSQSTANLMQSVLDL